MKGAVIWTVLGGSLAALIGWRVVGVLEKRRSPEVAGEESALVRVATARRADLTERLAFTGTIRPLNEVDVYPKLGGRIEALPVQVGDRVKAGQTLAVLEHKEIAWQSKAAQAAVDLARAGVDGARLEHDRVLALLKGGSATEAMADGVKVKLAAAQAQLAQAEAAAGLAAQAVANATITAPIAGTITRRPVNLGAMAGQQSVISTIQDTAKLKLEASVEASVWARLKKGAAAQISVDALPGELFPGTVSLLSPSLDPISRRAALEIEIDNAAGRLLPNMFARAEVTVGTLAGAIAIPKSAIYQAPGGALLYRVQAGRAESVKPTLGPVDGGLVAVLAGISEGDVVAISGVANLSDGARVEAAAEKAPAQAGGSN